MEEYLENALPDYAKGSRSSAMEERLFPLRQSIVILISIMFCSCEDIILYCMI